MKETMMSIQIFILVIIGGFTAHYDYLRKTFVANTENEEIYYSLIFGFAFIAFQLFLTITSPYSIWEPRNKKNNMKTVLIEHPEYTVINENNMYKVHTIHEVQRIQGDNNENNYNYENMSNDVYCDYCDNYNHNIIDDSVFDRRR